MSNTMSAIEIECEIRNLNVILEVSKAMSSGVQLDNLWEVITGIMQKLKAFCQGVLQAGDITMMILRMRDREQ